MGVYLTRVFSFNMILIGIFQTDRSGVDEGNTIPLTDQSLIVDISDALSEKDKVKFTVHTRTTLKSFAKPEFLVVRQHEEFIWLHDRYEENPLYAGYIVSIKIFSDIYLCCMAICSI